MTLTGPELRVLSLLYEQFDRELAWPELGRLQRQLFARHDSTELQEIVDRLEPRYVRTDKVRGGLVSLTLDAFAVLKRGPESDFLCFLRMAIDAYRSAEGELEVTIAHVRQRCRLDDRRVAKLNLLLQHEYLVVSGSRTVPGGDIVAWRIQDQVRRFADVYDIGGYLAVRDQLIRPAASFGLPAGMTSDFSFYRLAATDPSSSEAGRLSRSVFVAYPWSIPEREKYKDVYRSLEGATEVSFVFAEDRITDKHVLDKILGMIRTTAFGIYDVTGWNPNVTLEYGYARGANARAYIAFNPALANRGEVPADIRGIDRIQYTSLEELGDQVLRLVSTLLPKV